MTTRSVLPTAAVCGRLSGLRRKESETGLGSGPLRAARAAAIVLRPRRQGGDAVSPFSVGGAVHSMAGPVE